MMRSDIENRIARDKNILVVLENKQQDTAELQYTIENFCGTVVKSFSEIQPPLDNKKMYVCGDLEELKNDTNTLYIIKELSVNYQKCHQENFHITDLGKVPILISNAGVYFRDMFDKDYFDKIKSEHIFQHLTESNKDSLALRKGIYLTQVSKEENAEENEILHYRLLRCSSNFTGPTDNFRQTDHIIINALNDAARYSFEQETKVNHVLVQLYENKVKTAENSKEVKSKIKAHSDKTKDMPKEGIIVFCTFYDDANFDQLKPSKKDKYDWCYKETSGLTKLHFKLKSTVTDAALEKEFSVTLYPNSAFLIPLSTNRFYTHEIRPSVLNVDKIPVRMGYVARCSNLEAVHMNGQTYIKENGQLIKLAEMTSETMVDLRNSYYQENRYEKKVEYGKIHFSMNSGDYEKPIF
ncbi:hypothetical protein SGQ44_12005 [Flavobacterium sp. Fl-77]|uniref:2OG-Fe(II) oxygenase superfamily protein n=1 Tax=Flavobacterium flavipigmentatum TaxID=2893884 RepID=A0AAJ2SHU3_9FLAO|nr:MULTISPECIES: hypothetical protein [unclassified Flavobacterium]MDX6183036.1 hypothetical protein [Flavobacterium sp. Fl-33]MDX6186489.1 hypothetical protein [Flavobacterium sp. Fl-77]UFH37727.1 hypothetical protein LNP22_13395 [Flavobacterium sp. F-70]